MLRGRAASRRVLAPLGEVTTAAVRVSAGDMSTRLSDTSAHGTSVSACAVWRFAPQYSLLVRHEDGSFSAYGQKCPHLGCAVYYEPEEKVLECPCHEGFFNAKTGDVIAGPPQRGLNVVELEVRDGELWAVGGGGH